MNNTMSDKNILQKDHLVPLLRRLNKDYRMVLPVRNSSGDTLFAEVETLDGCRIDLDSQTLASAKHYLFPQLETLFKYRISADGGYSFEPVCEAEPTIFFGLRSCDLAAILYMDVIFLQKTKDPYYLQKRQNAILISLGCTEPFANCFCNATRSGPFLEYGFDLQFTDLGDRYFVETGRVSGGEIVRRYSHYFTPASEKDSKDQYQASLEARGRFKRQVHVDQATKRLQAEDVPESIWTELSLRCQDCGGCAYICPTCTCFTIRDQPCSAQEGERLRAWDACTFAGFTRMAGGHNPVQHRTQAIRKRFLHKLLHDVEKHGRSSCVGCGRCVDMCFGGVDIVRCVAMINELQ